MRLDAIRHEPIWDVTFTKAEVEELMAESQRHYDSTCRALSESGMIRGMHNFVTLADESENSHVSWSLHWRDVDLLCKVLERTLPQLFWSLKRLLDEYKSPDQVKP